MNEYFRHQLGIYASYHRDERNCLTHMFGIPIIFFAVILPLSLWQVNLFGVQTNAATVLVIPAVIAWLLFDFAIGLAIAAIVALLVWAAALVVSHVTPAVVWLVAAGLFIVGWALQIVGHARFEHRKPAILDNPMHMFIGQVFIVAKIIIVLG